jgi:hypothetical protein
MHGTGRPADTRSAALDRKPVVRRVAARRSRRRGTQDGRSTSSCAGREPSAREGRQRHASPATTRAEDGQIDFTRDELVAYKRPRKIVFVSCLPMTSTGKIMRRRLAKSAHRARGRLIPRDERPTGRAVGLFLRQTTAKCGKASGVANVENPCK